MKLTTVLLLFAFLQVQAKGFGQGKINLHLRQISIKDLLKEVGKQTDYRFVYSNQTLTEDKKVSIQVKDAELAQVLNEAFAGTDLTYSIKEDGLVIIYAGAKEEQVASEIRGKVTGADAKPLSNVSVKVTGMPIGTTTDMNGNFVLSTPSEATEIEFSLLGYDNNKQAINGRTVIDVTLALADANLLKDVVVTGYTSYAKNKSASAATIVTTDKIAQVPMTVDQILQGRVPGLSVAAGSGQPGQNAKVTIRGVGTINGSQSVLYVLDGIPIENGYFQALNPSDFESVTVLKDASAKAIYGSRGANGVIVITSKKGKAGKTMFDYKSQYGVSTQTSPNFTMMTGAEHLLFEEEIGLETNAATTAVGPGWVYSKKNPRYATQTPALQQRSDFILDSLSRINTDWRKFFFRDGKFMEQQLSASGGTENMRFYSSLNYYNQDGIAQRSNLKRVTLKNNMDFKAGKFSANINLTAGYSNSSFIESEGASTGTNPLSAVYYALGYEYPYFPDGTLVHTGNSALYGPLDTREGSRALERMQNTTNKTNQLKSVLGISLNYEILKGLVAKTRTGIDFRQSMDEASVNPNSFSGTRETGAKGSFTEATRRNFTVTSTSGLTYNKNISNKHDFEVSALFEHIYNNYRSFGYKGFGIESRLQGTPAGVNTALASTISGSRTTNAITSFIGLGRYTFADKYTLNFSGRYDGSSTLPEKNRWHGFYSVGANWDVLKEKFMQNVDLISNLNVRASYGTTASPFGGDFDYLPVFGTTTYNGVTGLRPTTLGNPEKDWEYAKETNIGIDVSFFKSRRIRLTADAYNRTTYNLAFAQSITIRSGFSSTSVNAGTVQNKGIELDLQGDVVKNKNLTWTVGGNVAFNHNEVTDLGGANEFETGYTGIIRVGLPLGSHYAPKWAGVDPATGNPQYYDKQGKVTTTYNAANLSVAEFGTYLPSITGGFNTSATYKGFYANVLFSFTGKVMRYNNEDYYNENPSFRSSNQSIRMLYDRWKKPGDIAILPRIGAARTYTSRDIQNASYLRLRNVNIGYNIPKSLLGGIKAVRSVQIFAQAQNLYTWTKWRGFDPENGNEYNRFSYPTPRTYTAGINVGF